MRRTLAGPAAYRSRPDPDRSAVLGHVGLRVLVLRDDAPRGVLVLVDDELDGDVVPRLQVGVLPEVDQVLALLFGHVVAVGLVRLADGLPPAIGADLVLRGLGDRVADLVVVLDRVLGLARGALGVTP